MKTKAIAIALFAAALLFGASLAKADDGMHGGWCPTDGYVYELNWLSSWSCDVSGDSSICFQDYECVQLYMICRLERAPKLLDREPMEVDREKRTPLCDA